MTLLLLGLLACASKPASIEAQDPQMVFNLDRITLSAKALDKDGKTIEGAKVLPVAVADPAVLQLGNEGALQCVSSGKTQVTLGVDAVKKDVEVQCLLVKEIRVRPLQIKAVLTKGPSGTLTPRSLKAVQAEVIGLDDKKIEWAPVNVTFSDDAVARLKEDGQIELLAPGQADIVVSSGDKSARIPIEIGEEVASRPDLAVADGEETGIPVEAGRYRVTASSNEPIVLAFRETDCKNEEEKTDQRLECTVDKTTTVVIQNPSALLKRGGDAKVKLRVVKLPPADPNQAATGTEAEGE